MKTILLYHGGNRKDIDTIIGSGVQERDFFATLQEPLAQMAASDFGPEGRVLRIGIPLDVFKWASERGYFEERAYLGSIPVESIREVVVHAPFGTRVLNEVIRLQGRIISGQRVNFGWLEDQVMEEA